MNIKKVAVIGGGLMGRQIALNAAIYPYQVMLFDINSNVRKAVKDWENEYLAGRIAKGRMNEKMINDIKSRFSVTETMEEAVSDADIIIEAVLERLDIKHQVLKQISDTAKKDAIIATNSSYMVSSTFKDDVKNPERLLNMHFFNPALVMKLVEIVKGDHTSQETADAAYDFSASVGKTPIRVNREIDGFIANRILTAIYAEARKLVEDGYCSYQDLDIACENGLGHPMGPFKLNDLTGIDLTFDVMQRRYKESGEKPVGYDLYSQMVEKGRLGRKTGKGFYDYTK